MLQKSVYQARQNIQRQRETGKIDSIEPKKKLQEVDYNVALLARNDAAIIASINNYKTDEEKKAIRKNLPQSQQQDPQDFRDKYNDEEENGTFTNNSRPAADKTADHKQQVDNTIGANNALVVQKIEPTLNYVMAWINDVFRNNQDVIAEARKLGVYLQVIDGALSKIFDFFGKLANFLLQVAAFIKWIPKDPPDDPPGDGGGLSAPANDNVPVILPKPANDNASQPLSTSEKTETKPYVPNWMTGIGSSFMGTRAGAKMIGQDLVQHETRNLSKEEQDAKMKAFNDEFDQAAAKLSKINQDLFIIGATTAATVLTRGAIGEYAAPILKARTAALMANVGRMAAGGAGAMVAGTATTPAAKANSLVMLHPETLPTDANVPFSAKSMIMLNKEDATGSIMGHHDPISARPMASQTAQSKQYQQMTQNITNNNQQFHANITVNSTSADHRVLAREIQYILRNEWGGKATNMLPGAVQLTKTQ